VWAYHQGHQLYCGGILIAGGLSRLGPLLERVWRPCAMRFVSGPPEEAKDVPRRPQSNWREFVGQDSYYAEPPSWVPPGILYLASDSGKFLTLPRYFPGEMIWRIESPHNCYAGRLHMAGYAADASLRRGPSLPEFITYIGSMLFGPKGGSCDTAVYRGNRYI
jgi:hypothetical protein